jgi:predicted MFS family arabinose efflux permease
MILTVIFFVQVSMNFNTSLYSNAVPGISEEFGVSKQAARCGAMIFLVLYAFGCELWAPWSEELGRKPILQLSLLLVNIWQLPVALAPNFASIMVGRALGGLSSAGGSVTLGMIADMWESDTQQYAVPKLEMVHLDPAHLWRLCPDYAPCSRSRDPNHDYDGQYCQEATQERQRQEHLGAG